MFEFSLTINPNAQVQLLEFWLKEQYPDKYDGWVYRADQNYITLMSTEAFTIAERNAITAYYNSLTVDYSLENLYCRVYSYMDTEQSESFSDWTRPPFSVDYIRQLNERLHALVTNVHKGEVREITYFAEAELNEYGQPIGSVPVVRETFVYTRDTAKMAISRTMEIMWYRNDGSIAPQKKTRSKFYTLEQRIQEGQVLRRNIIDFMQPTVLGMIMQTEQVPYNDAVTLGAELSNKHANAISSWILSARNNPLIPILQAETEIPWLDNVINQHGTTIRDYMLDQLNY